MTNPEQMEQQKKEAVYAYNGQTIEKLKSGKFSWDDYHDAFKKAQEFMIIKRIGTSDALELEKKGEKILWVGKKGEPGRPFQYAGPETKPDEKKAPERFLFDGLRGPLREVAGANARKEFQEARGKKREMADYFFGEVQVRVNEGNLNWKDYGDILKKAEGYGGILREVNAQDFEKIKNERNNSREDYYDSREKYYKADEQRKRSMEEELAETEAKKDLAISPIKYITGRTEGKLQEKFYTFAGTFGDRKRGALESQIYDEISGPILESVQEAGRRKKEAERRRKEEDKGWYEEAKAYGKPVEKKIETKQVEKPKSSEERYFELNNELISIRDRIKGKEKKFNKAINLSKEEILAKGKDWDPEEINSSIANLKKESLETEKELLKVKDEISEKTRQKLALLDKTEPKEAAQKFKEILKDFLQYAYPKAIISEKDFNEFREKGEINLEDLDILEPFIGKTPEIKEGQQVVEIKCKTDDVEAVTPFSQGKINFKKGLKLENLAVVKK